MKHAHLAGALVAAVATIVATSQDWSVAAECTLSSQGSLSCNCTSGQFVQQGTAQIGCQNCPYGTYGKCNKIICAGGVRCADCDVG